MGCFMDGFKKIPKMKTGGSVRKYEEGGEVKYPSEKDIYRVYDRNNNLVSKEYDNSKSAYRYADKLDKEYGASAHTVKRTTIPVGKPIIGGGTGGGGGADLPKGMIPGGPKNRNYKTGGPVGLYANIHAKRERIKAGSGEKMRKPGAEGAPTKQAFIESAKTAKKK